MVTFTGQSTEGIYIFSDQVQNLGVRGDLRQCGIGLSNLHKCASESQSQVQ